MLEAIPARIVRRVAKPEVGTQVDHRSTVGRDLRHLRRRGSVGEREEDSVGLGSLCVDLQARRREMGMRDLDRFVRTFPPDESDDLDVRVACQEANELGPDVAGRADDRDANAGAGFWLARATGGDRLDRCHGRMTIHIAA
jgi:hypothetical protein